MKWGCKMFFEDLEVWKQSRALNREIYGLTNGEKFKKDFGLVDQIRRASISIMSNIAEGYERGGNQEFLQFLYIAKASCGEVRCQLYAALDQQYITDGEFKKIALFCRKVSAMLSSFIAYVKGSEYKGAKFRKAPQKSNKEVIDEMLRDFFKNRPKGSTSGEVQP
jgi:four helix bundle protein